MNEKREDEGKKSKGWSRDEWDVPEPEEEENEQGAEMNCKGNGGEKRRALCSGEGKEGQKKTSALQHHAKEREEKSLVCPGERSKSGYLQTKRVLSTEGLRVSRLA